MIVKPQYTTVTEKSQGWREHISRALREAEVDSGWPWVTIPYKGVWVEIACMGLLSSGADRHYTGSKARAWRLRQDVPGR